MLQGVVVSVNVMQWLSINLYCLMRPYAGL
jgi:hypothetical protein